MLNSQTQTGIGSASLGAKCPLCNYRLTQEGDCNNCGHCKEELLEVLDRIGAKQNVPKTTSTMKCPVCGRNGCKDSAHWGGYHHILKPDHPMQRKEDQVAGDAMCWACEKIKGGCDKTCNVQHPCEQFKGRLQ